VIVDDDLLAQLVRDLGDALSVPADGPRRVLAAAAEPARDRGRPSSRHRPTYLLVGAAALVAVVVAGAAVLAIGLFRHSPGPITAASLPAPTAGTGSGTQHAAAFGPATKSADAAGARAPGNAAAAESAPPTTAASAGQLQPAVGTVTTKVVKTGTVTLQVLAGHVPSAVDTLTTTAAGLGGYVASTSTSDDASSPTADLTLRVPAGQFEALLSRVRALGVPQSVTTAGQDVTGQYVDLQARIAALEASRQRYLDILTRASTIGDILAVQQQLDGLQTQLEQLQGQLSVLADQADYATLTVHVQEPAKPVATTALRTPTGLSAAWRHARHGFAHGAESVIGASGGVAIFVVCVGLLALLARAAWALARRRLL